MILEDKLIWIFILLAGFISSVILTKFWIKVAKHNKLLCRDLNKPGNILRPEMGGIAIVIAYVFSLLLYIGIKTIYFKTTINVLPIFAVITTMLVVAFIGMIDFVLGWLKGLKQWQKVLMTVFATLPFIVINVKNTVMTLPFIGTVDFGLIYPILIVPLGLLICMNAYNMFAGYNGLETGLGIIILTTLGFGAYITTSKYVAMIAFLMCFVLAGFLIFNFYPAKVFPGDILTYSVGALIGMVAILANLQKLGMFLLIPYAIDIIFFKIPNKLPGGGSKWHGTYKNGKLYSPNKPIHFAQFIMKLFKGISEKTLVLFFYGFEIILAIIGLIFIL